MAGAVPMAHTRAPEAARRHYAAPSLAEYGRLETLTLGTAGPLPDYLGSGLVTIGPGCETFTGTLPGGNGATVTRTSCGVAVFDSTFH